MSNYIIKIIDDKNVLHERAEEVTSALNIQSVLNIIHDIKETMIANKDIIALSAPQIGYNKRIFCIRFSNDDIRAFVNPMITKTEGLHLSQETNASLKGLEYIVPRSEKILAMYQTSLGTIEHNKFEGPVSAIFEQMTQLLDGILLSDIGFEIFDEFKTASDKDKELVIKHYLKDLQKATGKFDKIIEKDDIAKKIMMNSELCAAESRGEVEIVNIDADGNIVSRNKNNKEGSEESAQPVEQGTTNK